MDNQFSNSVLPETPIMRINGELIARSVGSMVSIVGTVESVMGTSATIISSDNRSVKIYSQKGFTYPQGRVVEVIGTVGDDGSIVLQHSTGFDGTYNASAYNKLVEYINGRFHGEVF